MSSSTTSEKPTICLFILNYLSACAVTNEPRDGAVLVCFGNKAAGGAADLRDVRAIHLEKMFTESKMCGVVVLTALVTFIATEPRPLRARHSRERKFHSLPGRSSDHRRAGRG